eukprot:Rmarinus@m.2240
MGDDSGSVYSWLSSVGLEQYYPKFQELSINETNFPQLSLQDFYLLGVNAPQDRKKLFQLIQDVKEGHAPKGGSKPGPSAEAAELAQRIRASLEVGGIFGSDHPDQRRRKSDGNSRDRDHERERRDRFDRDNVEKERDRERDALRRERELLRDDPDRDREREKERERAFAAERVHDRDDPGAGERAERGGDRRDRDRDRDRAEQRQKLRVGGGGVGPSAAIPPHPPLLQQPPQREVDEPSVAADNAVRNQRIRVCVRKRPMSKKELRNDEHDVLRIPSRNLCAVDEPKTRVDLTKYVNQHEFFFDEVFDEFSGNEEVYRGTAKQLIDFVFQKGRATCFAYGQTGAGKTFTMMGSGKENPGLFYLAAHDLFSKMEREYPRHQVVVSFYEIYAGKLYDLLNQRKRLSCLEDGKQKVNIVGLVEHEAQHADDVMQFVQHGMNARATGMTGANEDSSRSHAILTVSLRNDKTTVGKLSFIDLAGSERAADTISTDRQTRLEGAEINKSLLALKECIRAMDMNAHHLPFRGSKLTQVLKDSFMGKSKTVMIANLSPNVASCEQTLNTLRYANRVKELTKAPGQRPSSAQGNRPYPYPHEANQAPRSAADNVAPVFRPSSAPNPPATPPRGDRDDERRERERERERARERERDRILEERKRERAREREKGKEKIKKEIEERARGKEREEKEKERERDRERGRMHLGGGGGGAQRERASPDEADSDNDNDNDGRAGGADSPFSREDEYGRDSDGRYNDVDDDDDDDAVVLHHQDLASSILAEEDELIMAHRNQISALMEFMREDMDLLNQMDKPGSSIDTYLEKMSDILERKCETIKSLQDRIAKFKRHLQEEETLSFSVTQRRK